MSESTSQDYGLDAVSAVGEDPTVTDEDIIGKITDTEGKGGDEGSEKPSSDVIEPNTYDIKPSLEDRFKVESVKNVIHEVLTEELSGKIYSAADAKIWTSNIANIISSRVREMKWKRYKHIVQVLIGEQRGAGVKCGLKCIWDCETDNFASETFMNESLFCLVAVFAIYFY